jgi:hypothetical protein
MKRESAVNIIAAIAGIGALAVALLEYFDRSPTEVTASKPLAVVVTQPPRPSAPQETPVSQRPAQVTSHPRTLELTEGQSLSLGPNTSLRYAGPQGDTVLVYFTVGGQVSRNNLQKGRPSRIGSLQITWQDFITRRTLTGRPLPGASFTIEPVE